MTAPTRASLVADVVERASSAWIRWQAFYGHLEGPVSGRTKPTHKVLGLIAVVASAALSAADPSWSLDLALDGTNGPVALLVKDGEHVHHVPITVERRRVRLASPGWGERETAPIALAGARAGHSFLTAIASTAAALLIPVPMDGRGRNRDV